MQVFLQQSAADSVGKPSPSPAAAAETEAREASGNVQTTKSDDPGNGAAFGVKQKEWKGCSDNRQGVEMESKVQRGGSPETDDTWPQEKDNRTEGGATMTAGDLSSCPSKRSPSRSSPQPPPSSAAAAAAALKAAVAAAAAETLASYTGPRGQSQTKLYGSNVRAACTTNVSQSGGEPIGVAREGGVSKVAATEQHMLHSAGMRQQRALQQALGQRSLGQAQFHRDVTSSTKAAGHSLPGKLQTLQRSLPPQHQLPEASPHAVHAAASKIGNPMRHTVDSATVTGIPSSRGADALQRQPPSIVAAIQQQHKRQYQLPTVSAAGLAQTSNVMYVHLPPTPLRTTAQPCTSVAASTVTKVTSPRDVSATSTCADRQSVAEGRAAVSRSNVTTVGGEGVSGSREAPHHGNSTYVSWGGNTPSTYRPQTAAWSAGQEQTTGCIRSSPVTSTQSSSGKVKVPGFGAIAAGAGIHVSQHQPRPSGVQVDILRGSQ